MLDRTDSRIRNWKLIAAAGALVALLPGTALAQEQHDDLPETLSLAGTVRDFNARNDSGGHTDFQWRPQDAWGNGRYGHYMKMVADDLDEDGKPVFRSRGHKVNTQWRDGQGRNIMSSRDYIDYAEGDSGGTMQQEGTSSHTSEEFAEWYRDVPGVNLSTGLDITFHREPGTNKFVFDDKDDDVFQSLGGFFPINNELYGNYSSTGKNFHFTFELATEFTFEADSGQIFKFIGDDDVWVFVDGKLVIDLGGVHGAMAQTIDLDRLSWLEDGETYSLHFFFAERHTTQSNFRVETTLRLRDISVPTISALYD